MKKLRPHIRAFWAILKGSKNKETAMKFIAFASGVKVQSAFAELTNYRPIEQKTLNLIATSKKNRRSYCPVIGNTLGNALTRIGARLGRSGSSLDVGLS